jgi:hypothetical protein
MADNWIKCAACKVRTNVADFTVKKDKRNQSCNSCCAKSKAHYEASKCEHGRQQYNCIDCDGGGICQHKRQKTTCIECGGGAVCEHKMQRGDCKQCRDPQKVMIKNWLTSAKQADKHRKQETNITREFCATIITESGNCCCYCAVELQMLERTANMMTIERIDNRIGHIIGNCRVACLQCNVSNVGHK